MSVVHHVIEQSMVDLGGDSREMDQVVGRFLDGPSSSDSVILLDGAEATSLKLSNARLRLRECLLGITVGTIAIPAVASHPWLIPVALIQGCLRLYSSIAIDLFPVDGQLIMCIFDHGDSALRLAPSQVNNELAGLGFSAAEVEASISRLKRVGCIKEARHRPDLIRLVETVVFK